MLFRFFIFIVISLATSQALASSCEFHLMAGAVKTQVRDRLSEVFEPFAKEVLILKSTTQNDVSEWLKQNPKVLELALFEDEVGTYGLGDKFKSLDRIYDQMWSGDFWSPRQEDVFRVGGNENNIPLLMKMILSSKYMISKFDDHWFGDQDLEQRSLLMRHSFTKLDFKHAIDYAFLSYLQATSWLSSNKPKEITDLEWARIILLPQAGESMSLVEKLSVALKPTVLGHYAHQGYYLSNPLTSKDGKWVFSSQFKTFLHEINEWWALRIEPNQKQFPNLYEVGVGCPAAFCQNEKSSGIRMFSESLLHVIEQVDLAL